jgi:hypothetical protein
LRAQRVCTEVLIEGAVFEHVVGGGQDGSGDGDNGLLWTTPAAEAQVLSREVTSLFARGRPGALDKGGLEPGRAFFMRLERRFPALSSLLGQSPAQAISWASVGKRLLSMPISDTITSAERLLRPGMVLSISMATRKGSTLASTS